MESYGGSYASSNRYTDQQDETLDPYHSFEKHGYSYHSYWINNKMIKLDFNVRKNVQEE